MMKWENLSSRIVMVVFALLALFGVSDVSEAQSAGGTAKTRLAVVGLDQDHVWSLLKDIGGEPSAEFVAIAESDSALGSMGQKEWPPGHDVLPCHRGLPGRSGPKACYA